MALIGCPECERQVSSAASACPSCAYPLAGRALQLPHAAASAKKYWMLPSISIGIRVAVGMILVVAAPVEKSLGSMAGGLIS